MIPVIQDHLGHLQGQRQPTADREQRCPQGLTFGQGCFNDSFSAWATGLLQVVKDIQDNLGQVQGKRLISMWYNLIYSLSGHCLLGSRSEQEGARRAPSCEWFKNKFRRNKQNTSTQNFQDPSSVWFNRTISFPFLIRMSSITSKPPRTVFSFQTESLIRLICSMTNVREVGMYYYKMLSKCHMCASNCCSLSLNQYWHISRTILYF